jgi:hypothetical protein
MKRRVWPDLGGERVVAVEVAVVQVLSGDLAHGGAGRLPAAIGRVQQVRPVTYAAYVHVKARGQKKDPTLPPPPVGIWHLARVPFGVEKPAMYKQKGVIFTVLLVTSNKFDPLYAVRYICIY